MLIILIIFFGFMVIWLLGVGAAAFHVFKYRIPGDITVQSFWVFLIISMIAILYVVFVISGLNWGNIA